MSMALSSDRKYSPRRGLKREEAALYIGISASKFDQLVNDSRMPQPRRIDGRKVWDIRELDTAFDELQPDGEKAEINPWDSV